MFQATPSIPVGNTQNDSYDMNEYSQRMTPLDPLDDDQDHMFRNVNSQALSQVSQDLFPFQDSDRRLTHFPRGKRKGTEPIQSTQHNSAKKVMSDLEGTLKSIDKSLKLSIHEYVKDVDVDPLIKEYIDKLKKFPQFLPILPDKETLLKFLDCKIANDVEPKLFESLIQNMVAYFQTKYFQNNVKDATENDVALFNPRYDLRFPHFNLLPNKVLEDLTKLRQASVIMYQQRAHLGVNFQLELFLLRMSTIIRKYLKHKTIPTCTCNGKDLIGKENLHFIFMNILSRTFFMGAREFQLKFNVKVIDWTNMPTKVNLILPYWRKSTPDSPPKSTKSRIGNEISDAIIKQKISCNTNNVKEKWEDFLTNYSSIIQKTTAPKVSGSNNSNKSHHSRKNNSKTSVKKSSHSRKSNSQKPKPNKKSVQSNTSTEAEAPNVNPNNIINRMI